MNQDQIHAARTAEAAAFIMGATSSIQVRSNPHPHGKQFVIVPKGDTAEVVYLDRPDHPPRSTGTVRAHDVQSFCAYAQRLLEDDIAVIYATLDPASFQCVLNDHTRTMAGWRDHRVVFKPAFSPEYKAWDEHNGKSMAQRDFAEFIEDNLPDFQSPAGAKMLEIAINFKAKQAASFKSGMSLSNGTVQFEYTETVEAGAGRTGQMQIPETFKIEVPVWAGLDQLKYTFDVRLRYRLNQGQLSFVYALQRPSKVVDTAFQEILAKIKQEVEGVPVIFGSPE